jgi:hypothetical protein
LTNRRGCSNVPCTRRFYSRGECQRCYTYRRDHGEARPLALILQNRPSRSFPPPSDSRVEERHRTITLRQQKNPGTEELCGACGTITEWRRGEPIPLCGKHRGVLAVVGLIHQDEEAQRGLRRLVTA